MKIKILPVLSFCLFVFFLIHPTYSSTRYSDLRFNFNNFYQQGNREWTRIRLGIQGGSGKCQYFYDKYPKGWKYIEDTLYVPKQSLTVNRKYPVKVRVRDEMGNQARSTVVYLIKNGKISVMDKIFPYDSTFEAKFYDSDGFSGVPSYVKSESYYQYTDNLKMKKYANFMTNDQLKSYGQAVNKINQISRQRGSGLNEYLKAQRSYDKEGSFSLITVLDPEKNKDSQNPQKKTKQKQKNNEGQFILEGQSQNNIEQEEKHRKSRIDIYTNSSFFSSPIFNQFINSKTQSTQYRNTSSRPRDKTFTRLPSSSQLDQFILTANSTEFENLVEQVNKSFNLDCQYKASYLDDFLGKIQSAISMKKYALDQLLILQQGSKSTKTRVNEEINKLKIENQNLVTKSIKERQKENLSKLQSLYNQYNSLDLIQQPNQIKIVSIKKDVQIQKAKSQIDRQQITRQRLFYNSADLVVQRIQNQLNEVKAKKNMILKTISDLQTSVNETQFNIKKQEQALVNLIQQVRVSQGTIDSLKINYTNLQSTVQRYRSDISKNSKKQTTLLSEIDILEQKLKIENLKASSDQYNKLKQMVSTLQTSLPTIQEFIDKSNFACFKAPNFQTTKNGSKIIYVVGASDFQNYIQSVYKINYNWNSLKLSNQIKFSPINIMDSQWQSSFGFPYDLLSFASTKDFSFNSDFNCLNPSSLESGYGTITNIGSKYIQFTNPLGSINKLRLGTCSRLQTTNLTPSIGQTIYWRGIQSSSKDQFNLYRGTCI